ncbi:dynein motor region D1 hydrolytic ATP-binding site protein (macronuclear) [Tetrahymena thermophila SB210]|uniref:Dynein motor region D1 hydrolytic ATP-binding site protein n=1 Tax=Tetrahymena thermophila (strain SB210) TaxID=312017 RepID=W7XCC1_TETTS|nr:dynein motor region D1 hydrolytic ATP-binding site protein [Tetrahymena thermophila SB210]EWS74193.1 dynein motor region D1 hydrolytic ATP-binding site protein [Tetrahymena thermophila SB210]|eukprot:XP_012653253.1 dynein motor region D1 hydrolytic ATP-binding site protein [Tetrahymena thermophila SB210]
MNSKEGEFSRSLFSLFNQSVNQGDQSHLDFSAFENQQSIISRKAKFILNQSSDKRYSSQEQIDNVAKIRENYPLESLKAIDDFITNSNGIRRKVHLGELKVQKRRSPKAIKLGYSYLNKSKLEESMRISELQTNSIMNATSKVTENSIISNKSSKYAELFPNVQKKNQSEEDQIIERSRNNSLNIKQNEQRNSFNSTKSRISLHYTPISNNLFMNQNRMSKISNLSLYLKDLSNKNALKTNESYDITFSQMLNKSQKDFSILKDHHEISQPVIPVQNNANFFGIQNKQNQNSIQKKSILNFLKNKKEANTSINNDTICNQSQASFYSKKNKVLDLSTLNLFQKIKSSKNEPQYQIKDYVFSFERQLDNSQFNDEHNENMRDQYFKLKIKNINNFNQEPLSKYDIFQSDEHYLEDKLEKGFLVNGFSKWVQQDGSIIWKPCLITKYNKESGLFKIQWVDNALQTKEVRRLNLLIDTENLQSYNQRVVDACKIRQQKLQSESIKDILQEDSQFANILISKKLFYSILNKSLIGFSEAVQNEYKDYIKQLIINEYKFSVQSFIYYLGEVETIDEFYEKQFSGFYAKFSRMREKQDLAIIEEHVTVKKDQTKDEEKTEDFKLNYFQYNQKKFMKQVDKIEMAIYNAEKNIDKCQTFLKEKSKHIIYVVKTSKELPNFDLLIKEFTQKQTIIYNMALRGALKLCFTQSLLKSLEFIENYYSILPLNNISLEFQLLLPLSILQKRSKAQIELNLKENTQNYNQIDNHSQKQYEDEEESTLPFKFDMKMIFLTYKNITSKCLDEYLGGNIDFQINKKSIVKSFIKLKFSFLQKSRKNPPIKDIISYILKNRNKVYSQKQLSQSIHKIDGIDDKNVYDMNDEIQEETIRQRSSNVSQSGSSSQSNNNPYKQIILRNINKDETESPLSTPRSPHHSFFTQPVLQQKKQKQKDTKINFKDMSKIKSLKKMQNKQTLQNQSQFEFEMNYVMYDILRLNLSECKNYETFLQKSKNREVTYKRLGWFSTEDMRIQIEPKLQHIEEQLYESFQVPIDKVLNLEEIYGCLTRKNFQDLKKELEQEYKNFDKEFQVFLRWNIYPVYSLLILINQFDFYLFEKDYLQELIVIFQNSNQIKFLGEERQNILKDKIFISNKIPDEIQLGIFTVDLKEIKQLLIKKMNFYIQTIDKALNIKFENLLSKLHDEKDLILKQLRIDPYSVEKYISLMNNLLDKNLKEQFKECQYKARQAQIAFQVIEDNYIEYDIEHFKSLLESQEWINILIQEQKVAQQKLEKNRNIFHKDFETRKQELFEEFKEIYQKQKVVIQSLELSKYEQNLKNCKIIEDSYKVILMKGMQINEQETQLGYELSDFTEFERTFNEFSRYVQFWEFTEKWFRLSDNWNSLIFEEVFQNEMSQEIKYEIINTCREGSSLLQKLRQFYIQEIATPKSNAKQSGNKFEFGDTDFLQLISQVEESIKKFEEYVPVTVILIDKLFTQEYQDLFLKHLNLKIKYEKLTINKLRELNVKEHIQFIYQLFNQAKHENQIKEDILKIQNIIIKEIIPICGVSKIPDFPTNYIQNGKNIIKKLNDIQFSCNKIIKDTHLVASKIDFSYLFVKNIETLIQSFIELLQTQEIMVKVCSFFGSSFDFICPSSLNICKQYETFKEDYKNKLQNVKMHFQRVTADDEHELVISQQKLEQIIQLKELGNNLLLFQNQFISQVRTKSPKFYMLSDNQIIQILQSTHNTELIQYIVKHCFHGIKQIEIEDFDNRLIVNQYKNFNDEDFHPSDYIQIPKYNRPSNQKCDQQIINQMNEQKLNPVMKLLIMLEEFSTTTVQKNIYQNMQAVFNLNYDFVGLIKLYLKKQITYQSIQLLLDLCFYHDLTVIISLVQDSSGQKEQQNQSNTLKSQFILQQSQSQQPIDYLDVMKSHIKQNLQIFIDFIKERKEMSQYIPKNLRIIQQKIILQVLNQIEILYQMKKQKITSLNCFEYLAHPKISLECSLSMEDQMLNIENRHDKFKIKQIKQVTKEGIVLDQSDISKKQNYKFPKISQKSDFLDAIINNNKTNKKISIILLAMNYKIEYCYQLQRNDQLFIQTLTSQKIVFASLQAIYTLYSPLIRSQPSSGKETLIKQFANKIGKQMYNFQIEQDYPIKQIYNIIAGAVQGGFLLCFCNIDLTPLNQLSIISSLVFLVRKALIERQNTINFENGIEITHMNQLPIISSFNISNDEKGIKFNEIPNSVLESFRIVNFVQQDIIVIIKDYFYLMNFNKPQELAVKFNYFMITFCESFFTNFQTDFKSSNMLDQNIVKMINYNSYIKICQKALDIIDQRDSCDEENLTPIDALKASLDIFFGGILSLQMFEIYQELFPRFFTEKSSLLVVDIVEDKDIIDPIKEYFLSKQMDLHESFISIATNFIHLINQKNNIIIGGKCGSGKTKFLQIVSFVQQRIIQEEFSVNMIPIDNLSKQQFELIIKNICYSSMINQKYILDELRDFAFTREEFNSWVSNTLNHSNNEKAKQKCLPTSKDWIVFDCGSFTQTDLQIAYLEPLLKSIESKIFSFIEGEKYNLSNEMQCIVEIDDLSRISPRFLSTFSLIYLYEPITPCKDEFQTWLKNLVAIQPKFNAYQKYLNLCYSNIFEDVLGMLTVQNGVSVVGIPNINKYFIFSFLSLVESLLNETRKREIALGLFDNSELTKYELCNIQDPEELRRLSNSHSEVENYECIIEPNNIINDERKKMQVEAIFILSICLTLESIIQEDRKQLISEKIIKSIKNYRKLQQFKIYKRDRFAFGLVETAEIKNYQTTLFDYYFDLINLKWVKWQQAKPTFYSQVLQNSFKSNIIHPREICRLNPEAQNMEQLKIYIQNELESTLSQPFNNKFLELQCQKKNLFTILTLLNYNQKILLASSSYKGKTTILNKLYEDSIRRSDNNIIKISVNENLSVQKFQYSIEKKIPFKYQNNQSDYPPQNIIFIDDLNLSEKYPNILNPISSLKCLLDSQGWYSQEINKFVTFQSHSIISSYHFPKSFENTITQKPSYIMQKCYFLQLEDFSLQDIQTIANVKVKNIMQNVKIDSQSMQENLKYGLECFILQLFKNSDQIYQIKQRYGVNLTINHFMQAIEQNNACYFEQNNQGNMKQFMASIIYTFNSICCDNFESNSNQLDKAIQYYSKHYDYVMDKKIDYKPSSIKSFYSRTSYNFQIGGTDKSYSDIQSQVDQPKEFSQFSLHEIEEDVSDDEKKNSPNSQELKLIKPILTLNSSKRGSVKIQQQKNLLRKPRFSYNFEQTKTKLFQLATSPKNSIKNKNDITNHLNLFAQELKSNQKPKIQNQFVIEDTFIFDFFNLPENLIQFFIGLPFQMFSQNDAIQNLMKNRYNLGLVDKKLIDKDDFQYEEMQTYDQNSFVRVSSKNYKQVEKSIYLDLISKSNLKERLRLILSMTSSTLVMRMLQLMYSFSLCKQMNKDEKFWNILVKHYHDEDEIKIVVDSIIQIQGDSVIEISSLLETQQLVNQIIPQHFKNKQKNTVYIHIKQFNNQQELIKIFEFFMMLFSSSQYHQLFDDKSQKILQNSFFQNFLTISLAKDSFQSKYINAVDESTVYDKINEYSPYSLNYLDQSKIKMTKQAYEIYNSLYRHEVFTSQSSIYVENQYNTCQNKVFILFTQLKIIFTKIIENFKKQDGQYKEINEAMNKQEKFLEKQLEARLEQQKQTIAQITDSKQQLEQAQIKIAETNSKISQLAEQKILVLNLIKNFKQSLEIDLLRAKLQISVQNINSIREESIWQEIWQHLVKHENEDSFYFILFLIIISDDDFFADRYIKFNQEEKQKIILDIYIKKVNVKQIKQTLIKSYNMFVENTNFNFDKSIEFEKLKLISQIHQFIQNPTNDQSQSNDQEYYFEHEEKFQYIKQFMLQMMILSKLEEDKILQVKQQNSKLEQINQSILILNEELNKIKEQINNINLFIQSKQNFFQQEEKQLNDFQIFQQKILARFTEIRQKVLKSIKMKQLLLSIDDQVFNQQVMVVAMYLAFFSGLEEKFRFKGLDLLSFLDENIIFFAKRLVIYTIQGQKFYYDMISQQNYSVSNSVIYQIAWIEFIIKYQQQMPFIIVKDYSGVIEEYFIKKNREADSAEDQELKNIIHFIYFKDDFQTAEESIQKIFQRNKTQKKDASQILKKQQSQQYSNTQLQNILILVNPQDSFLEKYKNLINKKYCDVFIDSLTQNISNNQNSNQNQKQQNEAIFCLIILYTDQVYFQSNLVQQISEKCIVIDCQIKQEFSWRYLQKDIIINEIYYQEKLKLIKREQILENQRQSQDAKQIDKVKSAIIHLSQENCGLLNSLNLDEYVVNLKSLVKKTQKQLFFKLKILDQTYYPHESYEIRANCVGQTVKRKIQTQENSKDDLISLRDNNFKSSQSIKSHSQRSQKDNGAFKQAGSSLMARIHQKSQQNIKRVEAKQNNNTSFTEYESHSDIEINNQGYNFSQFQTSKKQHNVSELIRYCYLVKDLEYFSQQLNDLVGFIYVIKQTIDSLQGIIGNVYGFSDSYFTLINKQVCQNLRRNYISFTTEKIHDFKKQYAHFFYQTIICSLREDHRDLFNFYLGLNYLKASEQVNDILLKLLFEDGETQDQDTNLEFYDKKIINKYQTTESKFNSYFGIKCKLQIPKYMNNLSAFIEIPFNLPTLKYWTYRTPRDNDKFDITEKNLKSLRKQKSEGELSIVQENEEQAYLNQLSEKGILDIPKKYQTSKQIKVNTNNINKSAKNAKSLIQIQEGNTPVIAQPKLHKIKDDLIKIQYPSQKSIFSKVIDQSKEHKEEEQEEEEKELNQSSSLSSSTPYSSSSQNSQKVKKQQKLSGEDQDSFSSQSSLSSSLSLEDSNSPSSASSISSKESSSQVSSGKSSPSSQKSSSQNLVEDSYEEMSQEDSKKNNKNKKEKGHSHNKIKQKLVGNKTKLSIFCMNSSQHIPYNQDDSRYDIQNTEFKLIESIKKQQQKDNENNTNISIEDDLKEKQDDLNQLSKKKQKDYLNEMFKVKKKIRLVIQVKTVDDEVNSASLLKEQNKSNISIDQQVKHKKNRNSKNLMIEQLIKFYKDSSVQFDTPLISLQIQKQDIGQKESSEKEEITCTSRQYKFFQNFIMMIINQGLSTYKDIIRMGNFNQQGQQKMNNIEIKRLKYSQEYQRIQERLKQQQNIKVDNKQNKFYSLLEDAVNKKILSEIQTFQNQHLIESVAIRGKLKLTQAIIKSQMNQKEKIRFQQQIRLISQEQETQEIPQQLQRQQQKWQQDLQRNSSSQEEIQINQQNENQKIQFDTLFLPQRVIRNFYHYLAILDKSNSFLPFQKALSISISEQALLKQFIYNTNFNYAHRQNVFKIPPFLSQLNINPVEACLIVKSMKPQDLIFYLQNLFAQSFSSNFSKISTQNLETLCRSNSFERPIILFTEDLNSSISKLIEIKMLKHSQQQPSQNNNLKLYKITLDGLNFQNLYDKILDLVVQGCWIIIEGIQYVSQSIQAESVNAICKIYANKKFPIDFKIFIIYKCQQDNKYLEHSDSLSPLKYLFNLSHKTYIATPSAIKQNLSNFYYCEINQHMMNVEKILIESQELPQQYQNNIEKKTSQIHHQIYLRRHQTKVENPIIFKNIEGLDNIYEKNKKIQCDLQQKSFLNLHSFVVPETKNEKIINMIIHGEERNKFNSLFVFSIIRQREQLIQKNNPNFINLNFQYSSDNDFYQMITDLLNFIGYHKPSPFRFMIDYFSFIFKEREPFNTQAPYEQIIKLLFQDFVCYKLDKQRVIQLNNQSYPLLKYTPEIYTFTMSYQKKDVQSFSSQKIFLNILNLPSQDPVEILGLSQNLQFNQQLVQSQQMLNSINNHTESLEKERENKKHAMKSIEKHFSSKQNQKNKHTPEETIIDNALLINIINFNQKAKEHEELINLLQSIDQLFEQGEISLKLLKLESSMTGLSSPDDGESIKHENNMDDNLSRAQRKSIFQTKRSSLRQSYMNSSEQFINNTLNSQSNSRRPSFKQKRFGVSILNHIVQGKRNSDVSIYNNQMEQQEDQIQEKEKLIQTTEELKLKMKLSPLMSLTELKLIKKSSSGRSSILASPEIVRTPNAQQYIQIQNQINNFSPTNKLDQMIHQQTQLVPNPQALKIKNQFNKTCLYDRIKDYLPVKKKQQQMNAQKDVLKTFSQMHKNLKEKPRHSHNIEYSKIHNYKLRNILLNNDFTNLVLMNEVFTCNRIVNCIRNDIKNMIGYLQQNQYNQSNERISSLISQIKKNAVPRQWEFFSLLPTQSNLIDFLKQILIKYEHIYEIVVWRNCELFPSLSLFKMFDPFCLIYSLLYDESKKLNVPIHMLKIQLCKLKRPPVRQNPEEGICIRGIMLKAASLNPINDYLQPESLYEFEQELTYSIIKVVLRTDTKYDDEIYIPIEFMDQVHHDLENRYIEQQQEFSNNYKQYEKEFLNDSLLPKKQKNQGQNVIGRGGGGGNQKEGFGIQSPTRRFQTNYKIQNVTVQEIQLNQQNNQVEEEDEENIDETENNIIHFIRLPVISNNIQKTLKYSHLKIYFFFKSTLPQVYWSQRGTQICFHKAQQI